MEYLREEPFMNKEVFLNRLESLLRDIPEMERTEAIAYYTEYFEDSELSDEAVIRELGTPEEVAHNIREEVSEKEIITNIPAAAGNQTSQNAGQNMGNKNQSSESKTAEQVKSDSSEKTLITVLIVIAIILAVPIWMPLAGTLFGIVVGVFATVFAIFLSVAICAIVFFVVGVILFGMGIANLFVIPLASICLFGTSFLLVGLSFLCCLATIKFCTVVFPAMFRGIVYLVKLPFNKKGVQTA